MINKLELEILIKRNKLTKTEVAKNLGISFQGFENKLNNKSEFKASEIYTLSKMLGVEMDNLIFFKDNMN